MDPYIEWVRNPLAVLSLAMVAAVLCGLYLHPRALILASGLAAVLAVGTAWPWLSVRGLSGTLTFGRQRVREEESVAARLVVRNRMPWAAWGLSVRGEALDGASMTRAGMAVAPGWRVSESSWQFIPERRGEYPGAVPRIATAFPFGLWEASRPLAVPSRLLVWPRTFPVGPIPEAASGLEGYGLATRNKAGTAGDLLGVRPYRRGASLRRVHWPQSARHGHLIVCELECARDAQGADRPGRPPRRPRGVGSGRLAGVGDPHCGELRRGLDRPGGRGRGRLRRPVDGRGCRIGRRTSGLSSTRWPGFSPTA